MKKILVFIFISVIAFSSFSVSAESHSYTYNYWGETVSAPYGYTAKKVFDGKKLGIGKLKEPSDLFVDSANRIYLSDTGNNRVVCLNEDLSVRWVWETVTDGSDEIPLTSPKGLFVDSEENVYICLESSGTVLKCDKNGVVQSKYLRPDSTLLSKEFEFLPSRVLAGNNGTVYVLIDGFFLGAIVYETDGTFLTFYGSNDVTVTAKMISDKFLRTFMTEEQKKKLSRYVPVQYDNFDIDGDGFIYTCTKGVDSQEIRRMNTLSKNVLQYQGNMGDLQYTYIMGKVEDSEFVDLCVDENGFISALDNNRGRIFQYDNEGNLLMIFGGSGDGMGLFTDASAIDCSGNKILVLDKELAQVTVFETTNYGDMLRQGTVLFRDGLYQDAEKIWRNVLKLDINSEIAYDGLGKALLANEDYKGAMECFKNANDREGYSESFKSLRSVLIKKYFPIVIIIVIVLCLAYFIFAFIRRKHPKKEKAEPVSGSFRSVLRLLNHPTDETETIKYKKAWNIKLATVILFVFFLSQVAYQQLTAFIFNTSNPNKFNILVTFIITVGGFMLYACINWAVTTLVAGKGKFTEIYCTGCYALLPWIFTRFLSVICSQFMVEDEKAFLVLLEVFGLIWSAIVLVSALRAIHEFTFTKVFVSIFFTALGMAFVVFLLMLFISLGEHLISFIKSIFNEIMYRR